MSRARTRRAPALAVLAGVLVAGGIVDRRVAREDNREATAVTSQVPVAAPASARSSAWYCPGAPATGALGEGSVVVANAGTRRLTGTVTVFPDRGEARRAPISVGPEGRASVRLADLATSPFASAVVELDGGEAVAEVVANGALGETVSPCASSASSTWYFAEGVTTRDATMTLLALNPFPDDAVVDVAFSTEEGIVTPQALTGLLVRGQALTSISVGEFVQRRESVSATVTARTGRLVVGRAQTFDGTAGPRGISTGLGAAALGPVWYFPEGLVADGQRERFQIYNPARAEAQVELSLALDTGAAEPLRLTVPRESRLTVVAAEESRIPKGVPHAVTVRTVEGPDVVVERTIDGSAPSARTGVSITLGARLPATRWATAAGSADDTTDQWVVVQNPGDQSSYVTLNLLSEGSTVPVGNLTRIEVPAGERRAFNVNSSLKRATTPLLLTATEPVVVERDLYRIRAPGLGMSQAIPLR
ncbi:MAG TPA: DUF5719 family protein [Acidimicrobiales bacterium]|nr:DUF5719 family protein [Acidimicrobiales bacterium]